MEQEKREFSMETAIQLSIGAIFLWMLGVIFFGNWFKEAGNDDLKRAEKARDNVTTALAFNFRDLGVLEQRVGENLRAYISKEAFLNVPYPDREQAIAQVGTEWCNDKTVKAAWYYLPKLYIYDIRNGTELGSYSCVFKHSSLSW